MTSVPSVVGLAAIKGWLIMKLDNYKLCSFAKTALVMHIYYSYITNLTKKKFSCSWPFKMGVLSLVVQVVCNMVRKISQ